MNVSFFKYGFPFCSLFLVVTIQLLALQATAGKQDETKEKKPNIFATIGRNIMLLIEKRTNFSDELDKLLKRARESKYPFIEIAKHLTSNEALLQHLLLNPAELANLLMDLQLSLLSSVQLDSLRNWLNKNVNSPPDVFQFRSLRTEDRVKFIDWINKNIEKLPINEQDTEGNSVFHHIRDPWLARAFEGVGGDFTLRNRARLSPIHLALYEENWVLLAFYLTHEHEEISQGTEERLLNGVNWDLLLRDGIDADLFQFITVSLTPEQENTKPIEVVNESNIDTVFENLNISDCEQEEENDIVEEVNEENIEAIFRTLTPPKLKKRTITVKMLRDFLDEFNKVKNGSKMNSKFETSSVSFGSYYRKDKDEDADNF